MYKEGKIEHLDKSPSVCNVGWSRTETYNKYL